MAIVRIKAPTLPVHLYLGDQPSEPPPKSPETRAAASRAGRLGFGLERNPPAAHDGLRSSRDTSTASAGSGGGGARSLGLVRIARFWFRGVPFGEEEGRGGGAKDGCVRERLALGLDFRTERTMTGCAA